MIIDDIDALSVEQILWLVHPSGEGVLSGADGGRGPLDSSVSQPKGAALTAQGDSSASGASVDDLHPEVTELLADQGSPVGDGGSLGLGSDQFVGATMAGVFEHPSLRTRSAFAGAAYAVGALPVFFVGDEIGIDSRESAEDVAHLLCEHHQLIGARLRSHRTFVRMAEVARAYERPMVNLLTDWAHPTQALADLITIVEHIGVQPEDPLPNLRIAYLGDANNVARSLTKAAIAVGWDITIAAPNGHQFGIEDVAAFETYRELCGSKARVELTDDPSAAVREARVLYTDAWISMGATGTTDEFEGFAIDEELLLSAPEDAFVMHCLPAHRGMEIAASVIDSERSVVWAQARNRLVAMERLFWLISEED
ncbi:hypothetical protein [Ferrimicrobium sp.]|uniref:ornithine carbamoyltransferase n=1 Tax=Ferrimicrobium sp. TaxID=2926050 RepID=UPI0026293F33|nr:hypothetical protein [Ferrimicrobium sp.]